MLDFVPVQLNEIKLQLEVDFPMPYDFALKKEDSAVEIIDRIRSGTDFLDLSTTDFNYVFQLTNLCTEEEFDQLKMNFPYRITSNLFDIGWIYCQYNPDNKRAVDLFTIVCAWMKENKRDDFNDTLIGHTDLPWEDIFIRSVEIMRIQNLSVDDFCRKFHVFPDTTFYQHLNIVYLSRCDKDELLKNEALLAQLISTSKLEYLRPTLKNYTAQVHYDEMSQLISDAISHRLSQERGDESIGLSPTMLQRIRQQRFHSVLEDCTISNQSKLNVYNAIAGRIKNVELLTGGYYAIDFGAYIVVDSVDWSSHAYAYVPLVYSELLGEWQNADYPDHYWPAISEEFISKARDVVLGIKKPDVIKLGFTDFDILYTNDLLAFSRY